MSKLKVGDRVRFLPGGAWPEDLEGKEFEITKDDDYGLLTYNDYYVQNPDGSQVRGFPVEKVDVLKIGDKIRCTGSMWPDKYQGVVTQIKEKKGDSQKWYATEAGFSVHVSDLLPRSSHEIELVTSSAPVSDSVSPEEIEAFKKAWNAADALGLKGSRVEAGLIAVKRLGA